MVGENKDLPPAGQQQAQPASEPDYTQPGSHRSQTEGEDFPDEFRPGSDSSPGSRTAPDFTDPKTPKTTRN